MSIRMSWKDGGGEEAMDQNLCVCVLVRVLFTLIRRRVDECDLSIDR